MSFFTTEKLLTYLPINALLIATNEKLGLSLHPSYVSVGEVTAPNGLLATVEITARDEEPNSLEKRFSGKGTVTIDRINIATFFGGPYSIKYDGAISSFDVARIITEQTGILFDDRDFPDAIITAQSNKLVVSPRSLRWVGELTIIPA
jgi:hypothetical protein